MQVASGSGKKPGNMLPCSSQKEPALLALGLNPVRLTWIFDLQNFKRTLSCFKPLSGWQFVTVAQGTYTVAAMKSCQALMPQPSSPSFSSWLPGGADCVSLRFPTIAEDTGFITNFLPWQSFMGVEEKALKNGSRYILSSHLCISRWNFSSFH